MPISHGTETLRTFSPRIQLELKDNTVSVVVDGGPLPKLPLVTTIIRFFSWLFDSLGERQTLSLQP
jgi:hypothetical protein